MKNYRITTFKRGLGWQKHIEKLKTTVKAHKETETDCEFIVSLEKLIELIDAKLVIGDNIQPV